VPPALVIYKLNQTAYADKVGNKTAAGAGLQDKAMRKSGTILSGRRDIRPSNCVALKSTYFHIKEKN